jgi:SAM-dependent methyltransferase
LAHLSTHLRIHQNELVQLLRPLGVNGAAHKATHLALGTRLQSHHGVLTYAANIVRDWCWGDVENNAVLTSLMKVLQNLNLPPQPRIAVLGSGAGRLAYDLQRNLGGTTFALDSNPLLCLIGHAMTTGESLPFTEFPVAPVTALDAAVSRTLRAPAVVDDLTFVCADAMQPPFPHASFDLVVTPWLVDVIDARLEQMIEVVASLLRTSGIWLNHGSVAFQGHNPLNRLSAEELAEMTVRGGFDLAYSGDERMPYLHAPGSRQLRTEMVHTQAALLRTHQHTQQTHRHLPGWIANATLPVPLTREIQTQITTTGIHAFIMSLVDGQRSIEDMAFAMEQQRLMPADQAISALRGFLTKVFEEAVAYGGGSVSSQDTEG